MLANIDICYRSMPITLTQKGLYGVCNNATVYENLQNKIGSPTIITECQRHFTFLLIIQQLTVSTAKFLQYLMTSKNFVCSLLRSP